jgi:predicted O-methyltransferase YrrM
MTFAAAIRGLVPSSLKRPARDFIEARLLDRQPDLEFDGASLRLRSEVHLAAIMNDADVNASFADDNKRISEVYRTSEILGGVNPGDRRALYALVAHFKPKHVLEIGTHVGASTIYIATALRRFVKDGHLTTADIVDVNGPKAAWQAVQLGAPPAHFLSALGLERVTTFVTSPAARVLRSSAQYDLIFLDGDHSARAVYQEVAAALQCLNPHGLVLLHDFYPGSRPITPDGSVISGPARAADRIAREHPGIVFLPLGNLPWQTKGGGTATSLALVARSEG